MTTYSQPAHTVIGYTADADFVCHTCAEATYGTADERHDMEGNLVRPVFASDELQPNTRCGTCDEYIGGARINYVRADAVELGSLIELEGGKYVATTVDGEPNPYPYQYAEVEGIIYHEMPHAILLSTTLGTFAFPPDHKINVIG